MSTAYGGDRGSASQPARPSAWTAGRWGKPPKEIGRHGRRLDEGGEQSRHKLPNVCVLRETVTRRRDQQDPAGPPSPAGLFRARSGCGVSIGYTPKINRNLERVTAAAGRNRLLTRSL
jgi:hypothetical protein